MQQADFTETNLTAAVFTDSNLEGTTFNQSNLEKADFTQAVNYTIDPTKNRMRGARFSRNTIDGLMSHLDIKIT